MSQNEDDISLKASINLSRNSPVALVVGAAGFLGSYLSEKLLDHRIQVIGVDNLSTGTKDNLETVIKSSLFHLIDQDGEYLALDLSRLDYIFIVAGEDWSVARVLSLANQFGSKIVFISWIDLYNHKSTLFWFKKTEGELAQFAKEHRLNARVIRLSVVFGPRMSFEFDDPIISLIQASVEDKLQQESTALEFSSRALFIEDAVNLIIKSMLSGGTAWKIFDGVAPNPVKVTEVKQILLDPLWHENKGFTPSELPPWSTPNLERTKKELHWHPKVGLVESLRKTLAYFKEHEVHIPRRMERVERERVIGDKVEAREGGRLPPEASLAKGGKVEDRQPKRGFPKIPWGTIAVLAIIFYGLVYPLVTLGFGAVFLDFQTRVALDALKKGKFEESLRGVQKAKGATAQIKDAVVPFLLLSPQTAEVLNGKEKLLLGLEHLILGTKALAQGLQGTSGGNAADPVELFNKAQVELTAAEETLSQSKEALDLSGMASRQRSLALFLPKIIGTEGVKNYLFLLQDSSELRPSGGLISALVLVSFENSRLKKVEVGDLAELESKLKAHIEPPKELKEDLGIKDWMLRDSNWEADFPSVARQIEWFWDQAGGAKIDGVVYFDLKAAEDLLGQLGDLTLPDQTKVSSDNLAGQVISKQGREVAFLADFTRELLNKTFFQSQSWFGSIESLGRSLEEKHLLWYFKNPTLSVISTTGLTTKSNSLLVVEANLGKNKANYFLDRSFTLGVNADSNGVVSERLQIQYTNRSPDKIWPGGTYKNRLRIFVPLGSKLLSFKWGEDDLTSKTQTFTDYGMTVYSILVELEPKQAKVLTLDWESPAKLKFQDGKARYILNLIKQPGTDKDGLTVRLPKDKVLTMDLSSDRQIEVEITQ